MPRDYGPTKRVAYGMQYSLNGDTTGQNLIWNPLSELRFFGTSTIFEGVRTIKHHSHLIEQTNS